MENEREYCAFCGDEINETSEGRYMVGDNFLQANYFDSEEDNLFCSKDCICRALSVLAILDDGSTFPT